MVQRKTPIIPLKPLKPEKDLQHQETRTKGGGGGGGGGDDLMKMLKKMRVIKDSGVKHARNKDPSEPKRPSAIKKSAESPNYMKPTSSWDARKEPSQVTAKIPISKKLKSLNQSKLPISSSPPGSALKPFKIPTWKPGLKRARPLLKKVVNRETCSSTLKDYRFPKALELSPGATEAEGTSTMRVCPYNYCSLNGHWHAPLPPLKAFMSGRRKILKAQKSFKHKGFPSFKAKVSVKDEKEVDAGQACCLSRTASGLPIIPLIEEIANDFFVEIYAKPKEEAVELENIPIIRDVREEKGMDGLAQDDESYSSVCLSSDLDQKSEYSYEGMDVVNNFMEFEERGQEKEDLCYECYVFDVLDKGSEVLGDSEAIIPTSGAIDIDWEEEEGQFPDNETDQEETNETDEVLRDEDKGKHDFFEEEAFDTADLESKKKLDDDLSLDHPILSHDDTNEEDADHEVEENSSLFIIQLSDSCQGCKEIENDMSEGDGTETQKAEETSETEVLPNSENGDNDFFVGDVQSKQNLDDDEILDLPILSCGNREEEDVSDEVEDAKGDHVQTEECKWCEAIVEPKEEEEIPVPENGDNDFFEGDLQSKLNSDGDEIISWGDEEEDVDDEVEVQDAEGDHIQTEQETEEGKWIEAIVEPKEEDGEVDAEGSIRKATEHEPCLLPSNGDSEEDEAANNLKARIGITRKRNIEDPDEMKAFNPRSPRFLPIEPDSEAEKVDLRHVSMVERKNAEECNLDEAIVDPNEQDKVDEAKRCTTKRVLCFLSSNQNSEENELADDLKAQIRIIRKTHPEDLDEVKEFNPRSPRFLEIEPDPDAEKVDLKHQMMDERKNAEEWMIDYALQQAVSKLAPARKRKVALLVEAFETVKPGFVHAIPMQACI